MALAYVLLGSNEGDREGHLRRAMEALRTLPGTRIARVSRVRETEPVGGPPGQGRYLNQVALLETALEPEPLLDALQAIEAALGRVRAERFGPRTIDLDILLHGDRVVKTDRLAVPHPRLHERTFALEPLAELSPEARHPVLQKTAAELLRGLASPR